MRSLFERCYQYGSRLEEKAELLYRELQTNPPSYYDGLRMVLLEGVRPVTKVRMPSGEVRDMLMLGSNSFLNLNHHPRVLEASRKAQSRFGTGAGSPPLYAGTTALHEELEEELARFCNKESALIFPDGYSGNLGVISALCREGDGVFCDSSDHASLFDGARLSGAELIPYLHLNTRHLERALKRPADFERFMGSAITVKLYRPRNGLKEIPGFLRGYDDGKVTVEAGKETITFEKSEVALVRLRVEF